MGEKRFKSKKFEEIGMRLIQTRPELAELYHSIHRKGKQMLILPIKKPWFDMILSGEKKEEYRDIKPYYRQRFSNYFMSENEKKGSLDEWLLTNVKFTKPVMFRNGYSSTSPSFVAECQLTIGTGKPEWGAEPGKTYYVLRIGQSELPVT